MKPLPHALLPLLADRFFPADRRPTPAKGIIAPERTGACVIVDSGTDIAKLRHILASGATSLILAKCRTGAEFQHLSTLLSVAEAEEGRAQGSTSILALTDGILPAPLSPQSLAGKSGRLAGLVWDQRVLEETLNARPHTQTGAWTAAFAAARAAVLLTAAAAGVAAYDSVLKLSGEAFTTSCHQSRDDGFHGRLAEDEAQAAIIETIYAGSPAP